MCGWELGEGVCADKELSVIGVAVEVEDDMSLGQHVDGKEQGTKQRAQGHAMIGRCRIRSGVISFAWVKPQKGMCSVFTDTSSKSVVLISICRTAGTTLAMPKPDIMVSSLISRRRYNIYILPSPNMATY